MVTDAQRQQLVARLEMFTPADRERIAAILLSDAPQNKKMAALSPIMQQYPGYKKEGFFANPAVKAALIGTGALVGASFLVPALAGGAAPAVGAGASTATEFGAGTGVQAAAAAGGSSLLHSLLPSIIGAGASLGGTAIAAHANSEAAKLQAEQAEKALQLQKEQYALQRQDTAPYRALGQGAVGNLGFLSGIDVDSKVPDLSATVPKVPYGQQAPNPSLSTLGQPGAPAQTGGGFTPMKAPNGMVLQIPNDKVSEAQSKGAVPA